ncbi:hypothetical protein GFB49_14430 [Epibacterium sp. SM1979]|uniref:Sulfotransferase family protein n=1 Tax=Tritonibacter litoralis TaxID=2662264 RepID=A0A843YE33_9RHOB|nr:hypothetical protein [Tritonibacter litoralis]MQQ09660.1 hypothetical protein [Tritonibacter litoralis]
MTQTHRINRFQVLGERNSGTNALRLSIKRNLDIAPSDLLGWKHGSSAPLAVPGDMLVVVAVRNVFDWARSMHAKPWHATAALQGLAFSEFLRAPWETCVDRARYFGLDTKDLRLGMPLQPDRHPITGAVFANILQMRNVKTAVWLGLAARDCNVAVLRLEDFQASPEGILEQLAQGFQLQRRGPYQPITRRLGARFKPSIPQRPATPSEISDEDRRFILSQLDQMQEAALGYHY